VTQPPNLVSADEATLATLQDDESLYCAQIRKCWTSTARHHPLLLTTCFCRL